MDIIKMLTPVESDRVEWLPSTLDPLTITNIVEADELLVY